MKQTSRRRLFTLPLALLIALPCLLSAQEPWLLDFVKPPENPILQPETRPIPYLSVGDGYFRSDLHGDARAV